MKTKIDTKKLYFTASHVSVELISVLQSKDTSQENEDTVRNGLNSVSLYELDSLVDQILLYCGVLLKFQVSTTLSVCTIWQFCNRNKNQCTGKMLLFDDLIP